MTAVLNNRKISGCECSVGNEEVEVVVFAISSVVICEILLKGDGNLTMSAEPTAGKVEYNPGDITWVLASTALVCLMTPGLGFFYSGIAKSKHALHIMVLCLLSMVVVSLQVS